MFQSRSMRPALKCTLPIIVYSIINHMGSFAHASFDIATFVDDMENRNNQTVLMHQIQEMKINRGGTEFDLGPGTITLFDFGAGRPCAFVYEGAGTFMYTPPDEIEKGQLLKFKATTRLIDQFKKAVFFYTVEFDNPFDTSAFVRAELEKDEWNSLQDAVEDAFDHLGIHMPNKLIGDLLTDMPGTFFYADFKTSDSGHLVFIEDPFQSDKFRLYELRRSAGSETFDVLAGYSDDNLLPSQRGVNPVDIQNYTIISEISQSGKMMVKCEIDYLSARGGYQYLYFDWYSRNKIKSVLDSAGDSLEYVSRKDETGFGVVLNSPLQIGEKGSITIDYDCKSLGAIYGVFYVKAKTSWFPSNNVRDLATYELTYDIPDGLEIISCGNLIDLKKKNDRVQSRWKLIDPVEYVSFNLGTFESKKYDIEDLAPVKVYMSEAIDHNALALHLASKGELSQADMLGFVGADVTNSLAFYTSLFGPCPFDTLRATEILSSGGQGSPGLIHLALSTFQTDDMEGYDESFRAHEVAHQWWGHLIDKESYRDVWITEGLANYCGLWFYQMSSGEKKNFDSMLKAWREKIFSGRRGNSVGSKAGPITLGARLNSTRSDDYYVNIYYKGGYIFHMIRYILHDYKTGSDDAFAAFLKSLIGKFKGKVITTALLQKHLEEFTGEDVSWFFDQWVYGTEIPEYKFGYKYSETDDGKYAVTCNVRQEKVPDNFRMQVPITVLFKDDMYIHLKLWIDQPEMIIDLPKLPYKPEKIIFNTFDAVLCKVDYD